MGRRRRSILTRRISVRIALYPMGYERSERRVLPNGIADAMADGAAARGDRVMRFIELFALRVRPVPIRKALGVR